MRPIFGTDLTKQPDILLEEVRSGLTYLRGQLSDITKGYGFKERIEIHEHGLTVSIMALFNTIKEIEEHRRKFGDVPCNKDYQR